MIDLSLTSRGRYLNELYKGKLFLGLKRAF